MNTSESINELATSLAKAQAAMHGALKDSANPFFKSKYSDLESVWTACRKPLTDNGLSVIQGVSSCEEGVIVTTTLAHTSGQWVSDSLTMHPKDNGPQAMGSCITYARRYALAAMVGVFQTDDDAEAAQGRKESITPHGEQFKHEDQKEAQKVAEAFRSALAKSEAQQIMGLHTDCNMRQDFYIAVSAYLTAPERAAIKKIIHEQKRNGA